jgi:glutathione S-transferase
MYILYYSPGACSTAAHVLLEECGADYEVKRVALAKGEQRTEEYRKINPHGKVPALAVNGKVITQNVAILPYIAGQFSDAKLVPTDPVDFANCVEFVGWLASTVHPAFGLALHPERPTGGADIGEEVIKIIGDVGHKTFFNCLEEIDQRVQGNQWMMGEQYTFADPYALVFYSWGVRLDLPVLSLKNYTSWKDRMLERPAVLRVLEKEESPLLKGA